MSGYALVALPGTRWSLWPDCQLRSAGLPANLIIELSDPLLEEALASGKFSSITDLYSDATTRLTKRLQELAQHPLLREAVTWQNYPARVEVVDKVASPTGKPWARRRREQKLAAYAQRYALKNETIGFFGPVGWARVMPTQPETVRVTPGPGLLRGRTVSFEQWAIDEVSRVLARQPGMARWLIPCRNPSHSAVGDVIWRTRGEPCVLAGLKLQAYSLSDGTRTVADIEGLLCAAPADVRRAIDALVNEDFLDCSLEQPFSASAEESLANRLAEVADPVVREQALETLFLVTDAKRRVAGASGDADRLLSALQELDGVFGRVTGRAPERRAGAGYAGRRVVYEDTRRDFDVTFGHGLLVSLADPLDLLLRSARWLVGRVEDAYRRRLSALFDARVARIGDSEVPFPALLSIATPDLAFSFRELSGVVAEEIPDFQRRWAAVLSGVAAVAEHSIEVASASISSSVDEHFPTPDRLTLGAAVHYSPDVMIVGNSIDDVNSDEPLLVLGELHLAQNTLDQRASLMQHPDPDSLLRADAQDRAGYRVLPVPYRDGYDVNTRIYPPAMLSPEYTYWTVHNRNTGAPGTIFPGAGMVVYRDVADLKVRLPENAGSLDLIDVLSEYIAAAAMNAFKPFAYGAHSPRITIDSLVVSRESWSVRATDLEWVHAMDPLERYAGAVAWKRIVGLPRRAFYRSIAADKPVFLDFASPVLVEMLAATVRKAVKADSESSISLSEMLPDLGYHWLPDNAGNLYCSEVRLVIVDGEFARLNKEARCSSS